MSIYFGLILLGPVSNQQRYAQSIEEINQYLMIHKDDIILIEHQNIIKFKSLDGANEFWLPKFSLNLNTNYYRIQEDDDEGGMSVKSLFLDYSQKKQLYIEIVWECLCIIKESFPSKVGLFQENLEDFNAPHWQQELLRRQLNIIQARIQTGILIKSDEIEDVFNVLETCLQNQNSKGILICLGMLQSELVTPINLMNLQSQQLQILQNLSEEVYLETLRTDVYLSKDYEAAQQTASNILAKVLLCQTRQDFNDPNRESSNQINSLQILRLNEKFNSLEQACISKMPTTAITNSILFQLKESKDLERVCYILDLIVNRSAPLYDIMQAKQLTSITIQTVIPNYIDKLYDETKVAKHCLFHTMIFMLINKNLQGISNSNEQLEDFCAYLQSEQRIQNIFYLSKEAIKYWIDLVSGMQLRSISSELYVSLMDFYNALGNLPSKSFQLLLKEHYQVILGVICDHLGIQQYQHTSRTIYEHLKDIHQISPKLAELVEFILTQ